MARGQWRIRRPTAAIHDNGQTMVFARDVPLGEVEQISMANCLIRSRKKASLSVGFCMVKDDLPLGYGEKSVYLISGFMKLTTEEAMALRWHRGFSDNELKTGGYSIESAFTKYPLAVLTHIADLQATYLDEVEGASRG